MAEYLILIYESEADYADGEPEGLGRGHGRAQPVRRAGRRAGRQDRSAATRCSRPRRRPAIRGDVVTDGPFAETKEALGGYYLIEANDLDQALAVAQALPGAVRRRRGPSDHGCLRSESTARAASSRPARRSRRARSPTRTVASGPSCSPRRRASPATSTSPRSASRTRTCAALDAWRRDGVPRQPGAWLTTTARRKALDALRRDQTLRAKLPLLVEPGDPTAGRPDEDDGRDRRRRDPRRPAATRLHLLPPGAGPGGAGRADAAAGLRPDDDRDRAGVPGVRADDGGPGDPGEEEDLGRPHRVPRARTSRAAGPARRGAHRRPSALHDRPHRAVRRRAGPRRPGRAGARPGADAARR